MESISTAELIELALAAQSTTDQQVQFWIAVTFALSVAAFSGGEKISRNMKFLISILYLATVYGILTRYYEAALMAGMLMGEAIARGADLPNLTQAVRGAIRLSIFIVGSIAAVWFLFSNRTINGSSDKNQDSASET
ncbi:MAG: hypothetical protein RLP12_17130 [Ekhidna sp.]